MARELDFIDQRLSIAEIRKMAGVYGNAMSEETVNGMLRLVKGGQSNDFYLGLMQGLAVAAGIGLQAGHKNIAHVVGAIAIYLERREIT